MPHPALTTPVRRTCVAAEVGACLEELVRDRLPPERELADRLAASRTSVREALREQADVA